MEVDSISYDPFDGQEHDVDVLQMTARINRGVLGGQSPPINSSLEKKNVPQALAPARRGGSRGTESP